MSRSVILSSLEERSRATVSDVVRFDLDQD